MTNQLFLFTSSEEKYLLRLSGVGTEHIINRQHEADVYHALENQHITEDLLYLNSETGIKVSRFLPNVHTCNPYDKQEVRSCMKFLKKFHLKQFKVSHAFDIFAEIRLYESQCGICHDAFPDCLETREHIISLRNLICSAEHNTCLCHIDPVYDNLLINSEAVHLIDWEYAGMCNPYIDVAMFCIYANYSKEMTDWVINEYLENDNSKQARLLIYAYMSVGAYLWVLWCEIKRNNGIDYKEYEESQYHLSKKYYQYAIELYRDLQ